MSSTSRSSGQGRALGFSVAVGSALPPQAEWRAAHAVLADMFPWLTVNYIDEPGYSVVVWGHGDLDATVSRELDVVTVLCGGLLARRADLQTLHGWSRGVLGIDVGSSALPASGRGVLLGVSSAGFRIVNDWTGARRVWYHVAVDRSVASTFEPVAAALLRGGQAALDPVGLYGMLATGAPLAARTMHVGMRVLVPDSALETRDGTATVRYLRTVQPTDTRWGCGWQEIIDEWFHELESAVARTLPLPSPAFLFLSGGIDSRTLAWFFDRAKVPMRYLTYGSATFQDTMRAHAIADALGQNIETVPIHLDYLVRYTEPWLRWFGAGMWVHGMYQFPALEQVRLAGGESIVTGFTGDPLEGMQMVALMGDGRPVSPLERLRRRVSIWTHEQILDLVPGLDMRSARDAVEDELAAQWESFGGSDFQRAWLLFQWNRVAAFSSYQPTMYDYYAGGVTPFADINLAAFTLSLPRAVLDDRRLFLDLVRKHMPGMAKLPGTFDHPHQIFDFIPRRFGIPLTLSRGYLAKAALGYALPKAMRVGLFREFGPKPNTFAQDAIHRHGIQCLFPVQEAMIADPQMFSPAAVRSAVMSALAARTDPGPQMRLWPLQAVLHRFWARP